MVMQNNTNCTISKEYQEPDKNNIHPRRTYYYYNYNDKKKNRKKKWHDKVTSTATKHIYQERQRKEHNNSIRTRTNTSLAGVRGFEHTLGYITRTTTYSTTPHTT